MPPANFDECQGGQPKIVIEDLNFDSETLKEKVNQKCQQLNDQQKEVYDSVIKFVLQKQGQIFVLDASGGTRKTQTINLISAAVRSCNKMP